MPGPYLLHHTPPDTPFPDVSHAIDEPNGLLAIGGDLSSVRLLNAYRHGIFPWFSDNQPVLWWSPDPRLVLYPEHLHVSRSLRKTLKKDIFRVTMDHAFEQVIEACSQPRPKEDGTWITQEMKQAYKHLHQIGYAHSVEAWHNDQLVGGLYGIAMGKVFFGESMFSTMTNASKVAFVSFVEQIRHWGFKLIDCQVETAHLSSLGAENIDRLNFVKQLDKWCDTENAQNWKLNISDQQRP